MLQCVAVCCSVLQCVAVCCSVLQCVAVCCTYHINEAAGGGNNRLSAFEQIQPLLIFGRASVAPYHVDLGGFREFLSLGKNLLAKFACVYVCVCHAHMHTCSRNLLSHATHVNETCHTHE